MSLQACNQPIGIAYHLLTKSGVITGKSQTEIHQAEVWNFPVMTEQTRLISYLLHGLFSAILKTQ